MECFSCFQQRLTLDSVLVVVVGIISVFIFIALLDTSFKTLLATSATALLSVSFIFGVTCQEVLASLIFLFVKHPFDVSDRVVINQLQYTVQEMSLLFTILKRVDGTQVQAPNSLLNTLFVDNIRRSAAMSESLTIAVDFATTFEQVEALRLEMLEFIQKESRDFQPSFEITISDFATLSKMNISLSIKHKANWQNDALRAQRRNKWMCALALAIKKLDIVASGPGAGDPANPFVVKYIGGEQDRSKALIDDHSDARPSKNDRSADPSTGREPRQDTKFDLSFGSSGLNDDGFDVNLRSGQSTETIEATLPYTIAEENAILVADEDARQGQPQEGSGTPSHLSQAQIQPGIERKPTKSSQMSHPMSRTLTGRRRSNTIRRGRPRDEEMG